MAFEGRKGQLVLYRVKPEKSDVLSGFYRGQGILRRSKLKKGLPAKMPLYKEKYYEGWSIGKVMSASNDIKEVMTTGGSFVELYRDHHDVVLYRKKKKDKAELTSITRFFEAEE